MSLAVDCSTKVCPKCQTAVSVTEFYILRRNGQPNGYCKPCQKAAAKQWDTANRERNRERQREYHKANRDKRLEYEKRYKAANPRTYKDRRLREMYGITLAQYEAMLAEQGGVCAICSNPPSPDKGEWGLVVDHCHSSGRVRGLLCSHCNAALGQVKENVQTMKNMIRYAEERCITDGAI